MSDRCCRRDRRRLVRSCRRREPATSRRGVGAGARRLEQVERHQRGDVLTVGRQFIHGPSAIRRPNRLDPIGVVGLEIGSGECAAVASRAVRRAGSRSHNGHSVSEGAVHTSYRPVAVRSHALLRAAAADSGVADRAWLRLGLRHDRRGLRDRRVLAALVVRPVAWCDAPIPRIALTPASSRQRHNLNQIE